MKNILDHWRLLRYEKAVNLMLSKDAKEIPRQKDVSTSAFDTKHNRGYFLRFFILGFARYRSINIIFVLRFALVNVAVFRQPLLRFLCFLKGCHALASQSIGALIFWMSRVSFHPLPRHLMMGLGVVEFLP